MEATQASLCAMIRAILTVAALICAPSLASAQTSPTEAQTEIPELATVTLPGPGPGETRNVYFWRPPNAPPGPLPVLYMADGLDGLMIAALKVRPLVADGRMRPLVIVGMDANMRERTVEYALAVRRNAVWNAHFDWFVNTVMPWAELHAGASSDPNQRGVGGFSNGGDFALMAAARRPDLFGAVMAHSPVNIPRDPLRGRPGTRWVLSAAHEDIYDDVDEINRALARHIGNQPVRRCLGHWHHDLASWRELAPGAVAWMFDLAEPAAVESPTERDHCRVRNAGRLATR
jgi:dienelactone hydrolase